MSDYITPEQELALRKVEELFIENIETVFQTGINPETALQFHSISPFDNNLISDVFGEGLVAVKISHKNASSGDEFLLFSTRTAALISDLMVMGDGSADFSAEEHLDAVQEIVDQIYGSFATSQAGSLNSDLEYGLSNAQEGEETLLSVTNNSWCAVGFNLELQGDHQIFHVLSPAAVDNFLQEDSDAMADDDDSDPFAALSALGGGGDADSSPRPAEFKSFGQTPSGGAMSGEIEMLMDLNLPITIELGRTKMFIKDIINLTPGSIIELEKLSGDPVDIYVNEKKFAEGEVVVIDENFGVRITELIRPEDRIRKLS